MNDCISRDAVLKEINCWIGSGEYKYAMSERFLIDRIKTLPPVNPQEPKWIPVSERLPEYDKEVLCFLSSDEYAVCYLTNNWGNDEFVDGGFGTGTYDVVAWMPLPKPYEPQESEDKG